MVGGLGRKRAISTKFYVDDVQLESRCGTARTFAGRLGRHLQVELHNCRLHGGITFQVKNTTVISALTLNKWGDVVADIGLLSLLDAFDYRSERLIDEVFQRYHGQMPSQHMRG